MANENNQDVIKERLLAESNFAEYTISDHEEMQMEFEIDLAKKTDASQIFSQEEGELLVDFKIY